MFSLEGKIALITGASQGIGETIARQLAKQGAFAVCASLASTEGDLRGVVAAIEADGGKADYVLLTCATARASGPRWRWCSSATARCTSW